MTCLESGGVSRPHSRVRRVGCCLGLSVCVCVFSPEPVGCALQLRLCSTPGIEAQCCQCDVQGVQAADLRKEPGAA